MSIANILNGDFVTTRVSSKPAIVISNHFCEDNRKCLISIDEYGGDYISVALDEIYISKIDNYEKLSILANFGKWFYKSHKELYQELIITTLLSK